MRPLIATILILLCATAATADLQSGATPSGPENLRLSGPAEVLPGETITVIVHGLPGVDMDASIAEQTAWIETLRFVLSSPDGAEIELDKELSMTVAPWGWRLRVSWTADEPGVYVLVCDWNQAPYGLALHRVTIRGPPPVPPVPPDPPIPPTPTIQSVMILRESGDQDATLASTINQLRNNLELSKRIHLVADPDMKNPLTSEPIPLIEAAKQLVGNEPLPRLIGLNSNLDPVTHVPMPVDYSGAFEAMKGWGVE
jgi:hypothetical protein